MTTVNEQDLEALLKRLAAQGPFTSSPTLSEDEVTLLADSLASTSSRHSRSLAYLALSKYAQDVQSIGETAAVGDEHVQRTFRPFVESVFGGDTEVDDADPTPFIRFTNLLTALFPLLPSGIKKLLTTPIKGSSEDRTDPLDVLLELGELPSQLQPALAELLCLAAGTKPGREVVRSRATEWLRGAVNFGVGSDGGQERGDLGALCAVALSKLGQDQALQGPEEQPSAEDRDRSDQALARKMMHFIESTAPSSTHSPALISTIEGLSVLSLRPHIKVLLAFSPTFLRALVKLSPTLAPKAGSLPVTPRASMDLSPDKLFDTVENSLCYGLTTILVNLTSPKPVLPAEDQQISRLRAMAISANKSALQEEQDDELDSDEEVKKRVQAVLRAGGVGALHGLVRAESRLVKEGLGKLCRNLVEDQADRLGFVKGGGFKVLSSIVRDLLALPPSVKTPVSAPTTPSSNGAEAPVDVPPALQALAKLIITTSPTLLFPPPHLTTSLNSLTPLYHLLIHASSTSLQRFEALMALTNLASLDPSIGSRIVEAAIKPLSPESGWKGAGSSREISVRIIVRVEELMLDDNELVRRAATELVCNLSSSPKGYEYFSGESSPSSSGRVKSRLDVLLILTGVDDLQTRLAAGGALAIVTESEVACKTLLSSEIGAADGLVSSTSRRSTWSRVSDLLTPDNDEEEEEMLDEDGTPIPVISTATSTATTTRARIANPDLVLRGAIILLNLVQYTTNLDKTNVERERAMTGMREADVEGKLMEVLRTKGMGTQALAPTVECLKILKGLDR